MTKEETKLKKVIRSSLLFLSACAFVHAVPAYATGGGSKLLATSQVAQQANNVTVTVVDQNNEPIIGASVLVVSTKEGGATNADGQCTIHANPGDKLQISYIGYTPQTVTVGNSPAMVITLGEDRAMLDEVVVVGYGTMRKSDVTGSIAVAKGSDMLKAQNFSALDNLRGKAGYH